MEAAVTRAVGMVAISNGRQVPVELEDPIPWYWYPATGANDCGGMIAAAVIGTSKDGEGKLTGAAVVVNDNDRNNPRAGKDIPAAMGTSDGGNGATVVAKDDDGNASTAFKDNPAVMGTSDGGDGAAVIANDDDGNDTLAASNGNRDVASASAGAPTQ